LCDEIAYAMKSLLRKDEIFGVASDEIKSTLFKGWI
jgi:hypothetical protein